MRRYHGKYAVTGDYTALKVWLISIACGWVVLNLNYDQWKTELVSPLPDHPVAIPTPKIIKAVVPRAINCTTETCHMIAYIGEKFGNDADEAIAIIKTCENGTFDPARMSGLNIQQSGRRSYDVGLMQINVDENNTAEIERLKDWQYNIDRGYQKYHAAGDKFTAWTCAHVVGQKNYLGL